MSTRGFMGVIIDSRTKITAIGSDAYPGGAGTDILWDLRNIFDLDKLAEYEDKARQLILVPKEAELLQTSEFLEKKKEVPDGENLTWNQIFSLNSGQFRATLDFGVAIEASNAPYTSLNTEYGYLVNFDLKILEIFRGFQYSSHDNGRFAYDKPYSPKQYPVALHALFSFEEIIKSNRDLYWNFDEDLWEYVIELTPEKESKY